jgi:hypothetical protein
MDLNHIVRPHGQSPLPRLVKPSLYLDAHGRLPDEADSRNHVPQEQYLYSDRSGDQALSGGAVSRCRLNRGQIQGTRQKIKPAAAQATAGQAFERNYPKCGLFRFLGKEINWNRYGDPALIHRGHRHCVPIEERIGRYSLLDDNLVS